MIDERRIREYDYHISEEKPCGRLLREKKMEIE